MLLHDLVLLTMLIPVKLSVAMQRLPHQNNFSIKQNRKAQAVLFMLPKLMVPGDTSDCGDLQVSQVSQDDAKLTPTF